MSRSGSVGPAGNGAPKLNGVASSAGSVNVAQPFVGTGSGAAVSAAAADPAAAAVTTSSAPYARSLRCGLGMVRLRLSELGAEEVRRCCTPFLLADRPLLEWPIGHTCV